MIILTEPRNAMPVHRYLVAQVSRDGHMRLARCERP